MKQFKDFLIRAEPFNPDLLSSILWELDITGIIEDDGFLHVYADEVSNLNQRLMERQLKKLQKEGLLQSFSVEETVLEDKNWNEDWEKSLNIIHVTDKIVIKPSAKEYKKKKNEIIITIDPKMSFGTGEHQTTRLVIQLLDKYIKPGMSILDAGTGTGILAIAAVKLGAAKAIGFDVDEWCFENAIENCLINNVPDKVGIRSGDISVVPEKDFDMILANIQKNILMGLSVKFFEILRQGGGVLLSGLLKEDEDDILREYTYRGFKHNETLQLDEWIAMGFFKP